MSYCVAALDQNTSQTVRIPKIPALLRISFSVLTRMVSAQSIIVCFETLEKFYKIPVVSTDVAVLALFPPCRKLLSYFFMIRIAGRHSKGGSLSLLMSIRYSLRLPFLS